MSGVSKCKKGYRKVGDRCILNKKKRIFSVKPIDAILDENYFINFVKDAMSFDEKSS